MIKQLFGDIRIVAIESPYDTLNDPFVQELFSRLVHLKIEGYRTVYEYGVLPVDTYDFVATHHIVCRETRGNFEVLMGYKSITLKKCMTHRLDFPGMALLRSSRATPHDQALGEVLARYADHPEKVSYASSWAIQPEAKKNPALRNLLKDLMTVMLTAHETELGTQERLGCGVPKVKTDQYYEHMGYQRVSYHGAILPPFSQASLIDEHAVLIHCTQYSDYALDLVHKYKDFWDARLIIRPDTLVAEKKAA